MGRGSDTQNAQASARRADPNVQFVRITSTRPYGRAGYAVTIDGNQVAHVFRERRSWHAWVLPDVTLHDQMMPVGVNGAGEAHAGYAVFNQRMRDKFATARQAKDSAVRAYERIREQGFEIRYLRVGMLIDGKRIQRIELDYRHPAKVFLEYEDEPRLYEMDSLVPATPPAYQRQENWPEGEGWHEVPVRELKAGMYTTYGQVLSVDTPDGSAVRDGHVHVSVATGVQIPEWTLVAAEGNENGPYCDEDWS